MRALLPWLVAASSALLVLPNVALADGPVAAASPPVVTPTVTEWYGWQTLLADVASVGLTAAALGNTNSAAAGPLALAGTSGFIMGAPFVHGAHDRWGLMGADVGLRAGSLIVGGLLGIAFGGAIGGSCGAGVGSCDGSLQGAVNGFLVGTSVGAVIASAIDATVFAREKVPRYDAPPPAFTWSPSVRMVKDGAVAGVGGTF